MRHKKKQTKTKADAEAILAAAEAIDDLPSRMVSRFIAEEPAPRSRRASRLVPDQKPLCPSDYY